jgi:hypothetical protein
MAHDDHDHHDHHGHHDHGHHDHGHDRHDNGPEGTDFLDLEISRVLFNAADEMTRDAAREIMRDAIRERLRARLGDKLKALGELAADMLADDIEANLAIEDAIEHRKQARKDLDDRVRAIFTKR